MSIYLMSEVWKLDFPRHTQSLMLALADHASDDGSNIYPSIRYLGWKTGYSERQVQRLIQILIKDGVLRIAKPATNLHPNQYQMNLAHCRKKPPFLRGDKKSRQNWDDKSETVGVTNYSIGGDIVMTPKPPTESVIETPPQVKPVVVVPKSLIFPSGISSLLAKEMEKRLAGIEVSNSQALIDELAGRMKVEVIKNPVGYLSALLKKFLSGDFYPELGIQVKKNRGILKNREALEKEADRKMQSVGQVDKSEPTKEFKQILAEMKRKT